MKKPTKRKMYHKRRKKEKADQRKNNTTEATQTNKQPSRLATKCKSNNHNNRQYHRMPHKRYNNNNQQTEFVQPLNSYTHGLQVWWHTYCTAIQYHTDQQKHLNKEETEKVYGNTKADNNLSLLEKYANEYDTSSEEDDEDVEKQPLDEEDYFNDDSNMVSNADDDVDEEYLKFLEITHKHREELKLKKRAEEDV